MNGDIYVMLVLDKNDYWCDQTINHLGNLNKTVWF